MAFVVLYDANVLYPSTLRDLLIRIAQAGLVQAKWTDQILDEVFGTFDKASTHKKDYLLPTAKITNPDVTRLINSDEIQSVVRPAGQKIQKRPWTQKKNPLVNKAVLFRLNPYAKTLRRQELLKQERIKAKGHKKEKKKSVGKVFLDNLHAP